jgi:hypothetical protein
MVTPFATWVGDAHAAVKLKFVGAAVVVTV